jgi:hypothetical protein
MFFAVQAAARSNQSRASEALPVWWQIMARKNQS